MFSEKGTIEGSNFRGPDLQCSSVPSLRGAESPSFLMVAVAIAAGGMVLLPGSVWHLD